DLMTLSRAGVINILLSLLTTYTDSGFVMNVTTASSASCFLAATSPLSTVKNVLGPIEYWNNCRSIDSSFGGADCADATRASASTTNVPQSWRIPNILRRFARRVWGITWVASS